MLRAAVSVLVEGGYVGSKLARQQSHSGYQHAMSVVNAIVGVNSRDYVPRQPVPLDEHWPQPGWTEDDISEARNLRLEEEFDAGCPVAVPDRHWSPAKESSGAE